VYDHPSPTGLLGRKVVELHDGPAPRKPAKRKKA
jgi:hypothetical protein